MPKISVVMPVYNAVKTLRRSVESILNQTFADFEFIIVNEFGSDDGSQEMIEEYAKLDNRVRLIQNTYRQGFAESLNIGILESKGVYIARMDADDYSYPSRFEKQISYLDNHLDCVLCGTYFRMVMPAHKDYIIKNPCEDDEIKAKLLFECSFGHPTVMFRRADFVKHDWFYDSKHRGEDFELWTRVDGGMKNLPEVLVDYYWHGDNFSILHEEDAAYGACEIVKAQMRRKLHISTKDYHDSIFCLDLIKAKLPRFDLIVEGLRLLLEIEEKNLYYKCYNQEILANCLLNRWNQYVKVLFSEFADEAWGIFSVTPIDGSHFADTISFRFGIAKNELYEEVRKRILYWQTMLKKLQSSRVLVFGVGEQARKFFSRYPMMLKRVIAFSDNDSYLWGSELFQKKICPIDDISPLSYDWIVISSEKYFDEILDSLVSIYHIPKKIIADLGILRLIQFVQEEETAIGKEV